MQIVNKVNHLLKLGYDKDIILMTLGITDSQFENIKKEIQEKQETAQRAKASQPKAKTKIQLLRERYYQLYNSEKKDEERVLEKNPLSDEEREEMSKKLDYVEEQLATISSKQTSEQNKIVKEILGIYSNLMDLNLPSDLAIRACIVLKSKPSRLKDTRASGALRSMMSKYTNKYYEAISDEINQLNDVVALKDMSKKIRVLYDSSYMVYSSLQGKIDRKISAIKMSQYKDQTKMLDGVTTQLVDSLVDPSTSLESLKEQIKQNGQAFYESRKKMIEGATTNKFLKADRFPTMEGSIKQVEHQLIEKLKSDYEIKDIDFLHHRLLELGIDRSVIIGVIVDNLLSRKRFDEAEGYIKKTIVSKEEQTEIDLGRTYYRRIRIARISDFIMRGINAEEGSIEDENKFFDMIERGIERAKIDPKNLVLGFSKDGKTKITWNDLTARDKKKVDMDFSD